MGGEFRMSSAEIFTQHAKHFKVLSMLGKISAEDIKTHKNLLMQYYWYPQQVDAKLTKIPS